jgi:hypothetical protein
MLFRHTAAAFIAASLLVTPAATAKDFEPGDLSVCNRTRCLAIINPAVLSLFSSFYYREGRATAVRAPRRGAPAFRLQIDGSVAGLVATARLDRALVYGLNCGRFHRGDWYSLPARAALELRRLTAGLVPLRVTRFVPRSC